MSKEAYARVIDLIAAEAVDFRKVALGLAKEAPEAFLLLHDESGQAAPKDLSDFSSFERELLHMMYLGKKVDAIKATRAHLHYGLKEAKDYCDTLWDRAKRLDRAAKLSNEDASVSLGELLREKLGVQTNGEVKTAEPTW